MKKFFLYFFLFFLVNNLFSQETFEYYGGTQYRMIKYNSNFPLKNQWIVFNYNSYSYTKDFGKTYTEIVNIPINNTLDVFFVDSNSIIAYNTYQIAKSNDLGYSWKVVFEKSDLNLKKIKPLKNIIWAISQNEVFQSIDLGSTWDQKTKLEDENLYDIFPYDENRAVFLSYNYRYLISNDAGKSLVPVNLDGVIPKQLLFIDSNHYFMIDENESFYESTNSGLNWKLKDSIHNYYYITTYKNHLYALIDSGRIVQSTDLGLNWIPKSKLSTQKLKYFAFHDDICFIINDMNELIISKDFCSNWDIINNNTKAYIKNILCIDDKNIVVIDNNNTLYISNNNGILWHKSKHFDFNYQINSLNYINNTIILTTEDGAILASTDYGDTWTTLSFLNVAIYDIKKLNDTTLVCVGNNNSVFVSNDQGNNWEKKATYCSGNFRSISVCNDSTAYIAGDSFAIYRTKNAGKTWEQVSKFQIYRNIYRIFFFNENEGFISDNHYISKTLDGCKTFKENDFSSNSNINIHFFDMQHGYLTNGDLYSTKDSGNTWNIINLDNYYSVLCISFYNKSYAWLGGYEGLLVKMKNIVTYINEENDSEIDLNVYPNPCINSLKIQSKYFDKSSNLQLYNELGQNISSNLKFSLDNFDIINIDLSYLDKGIYWIKIPLVTKDVFRKIVVNK